MRSTKANKNVLLRNEVRSLTGVTKDGFDGGEEEVEIDLRRVNEGRNVREGGRLSGTN